MWGVTSYACMEIMISYYHHQFSLTNNNNKHDNIIYVLYYQFRTQIRKELDWKEEKKEDISMSEERQ